ncbi:hypothetical protein HPP92_022571 [Vanilla planifolia]|uniref:Uncharacterized protein n=1 Tax=Vanilla planifolia TaxID=51239 RepID=A0A835PPX0_VANPL|nr:hypothetical protein HPP92_022571 [Vanilla planifolia]
MMLVPINNGKKKWRSFNKDTSKNIGMGDIVSGKLLDGYRYQKAHLAKLREQWISDAQDGKEDSSLKDKLK